MNLKKYLLLCLLFASSLSSLEYGLRAKRQGDIAVTHFTIFSERCSGSNYFRTLLLNNLIINQQCIGHKHFPPWFDLPESMWNGPKKCYSYENTDHIIVFFIVRNPYVWAQSLHRTPWHAHPNLKEISFHQFIRKQWLLNPNDAIVNLMTRYNPLVDRDPATGLQFDNIFKLRTAKILNMMMIEDRVKNFYMINYETVRDNPRDVLKEIAEIFGLNSHSKYVPVNDYKGDPIQGGYKPSKYPKLHQKTVLYIKKQLDLTLEEIIGYE